MSNFPQRTASIEIEMAKFQRHHRNHPTFTTPANYQQENAGQNPNRSIKKNQIGNQYHQDVPPHGPGPGPGPFEEPVMHQSYSILKGVIGVIGGLFIHLVIASLYQWSSINIYITSYFKLVSDPSITLESNAVVYPAMMICIGFTMRLGLYLAKTFGNMKVLIGANLLCSLTMFLSSFMKANFMLFVLFYGIIFGLGAGLTFMIPIVQCNKYFPGKRMRVNGAILVGTGLGACVFGTFSYHFINPEQLKPNHGYYIGSPQLNQIAQAVPTCLRYLALLYLGIGGLGNLMIWPLIKYNNEYTKTHQVIDINQHEAESICQGLSSGVFWHKIVVLICATCGIFLLTGNYKTYAKSHIHDDGFLTLIGTIGAIGNGCSRFCWSLLFSKTGYKFVMTLNICLSALILITVRFTLEYPPLFLIEIFLTYCSLGGYLVITPTFSQALFGPEVGSNIYGCFWTTYSLSNFVQYGFINALKDSVGFDGILDICTGMALFALPIVVFNTWKGPWENKTTNLQFFCSWEQEKEVEKERKQIQQEQEVSGADLIRVRRMTNSHDNHSHSSQIRTVYKECLSDHCNCHMSQYHNSSNSIALKKSCLKLGSGNIFVKKFSGNGSDNGRRMDEHFNQQMHSSQKNTSHQQGSKMITESEQPLHMDMSASIHQKHTIHAKDKCIRWNNQSQNRNHNHNQFIDQNADQNADQIHNQNPMSAIDSVRQSEESSVKNKQQISSKKIVVQKSIFQKQNDQKQKAHAGAEAELSNRNQEDLKNIEKMQTQQKNQFKEDKEFAQKAVVTKKYKKMIKVGLKQAFHSLNEKALEGAEDFSQFEQRQRKI